MTDAATATFVETLNHVASLGLPIDEAVQEARTAMRATDPDGIEWAVPVVTTSVDGGLFTWTDRTAATDVARPTGIVEPASDPR